MASPSLAQHRALPILLGAGTIIGAFVLLEVLLRYGVVNKYVVPLPSQVLMALERIVVEENILGRIRETAWEMFVSCIAVIVLGVPIGSLLYRWRSLRQAVLDWVAAMAAAPRTFLPVRRWWSTVHSPDIWASKNV